MTRMRYEAENWSLTNYVIEEKSFASSGGLISIARGSSITNGIASFSFDGGSGYYEVSIGLFDERDGRSTLLVRKGDQDLASLVLEDDSRSTAGASVRSFREISIGRVFVQDNAVFTFSGTENAGERARIDYIDFKPLETPDIFRVEAESWFLESNYETENNRFASSGQLIGIAGSNGSEGSASFRFSGINGRYKIRIRVVDESDGISNIIIKQGNNLLQSITLNDSKNTPRADLKSYREIRLGESFINNGDLFSIVANRSQGERARIDYIEFEKLDFVNPNILELSSQNRPVFADLSKKKVTFGKEFAINLSGDLKTIFVGDSITDGDFADYAKPTGAWRQFFIQRLLDVGISVKALGTQRTGSGFDADHEAYGGKKIANVTNNLSNNQIIDQTNPELIVIHLGTNDTRPNRSTSRLVRDLRSLIEEIRFQDNDVKIAVSSLTPINGNTQTDIARNGRVNSFNREIPGVVDDYAGVNFIDAGGFLNKSDLTDKVHPSISGFRKLGDRFFDQLFQTNDIAGRFDSLVGTEFNDTLVGDSRDNLLSGGPGENVLKGNGGSDIFVISDRNIDKIEDFTAMDFIKFDLGALNVDSNDIDFLNGTFKIGDTIISELVGVNSINSNQIIYT